MKKLSALAEESTEMEVPCTEQEDRRKRRRRPVRGKTLQVRKMPKEYRKLLGILYPDPEFEFARPQTRAECNDASRPCPFVSCRYHLYLDFNEEKRNGAIKINFPDLDVDQMSHSCSLDLSEEGARTPDEVLDPCPKGWDYDPMLSHELGELAIETGIFPLYEVEDGELRYYGKTKAIVDGRARKPVREYLLKQGRFAHFSEEDLAYFQVKVDEMWDKWEISGVIPFKRLEATRAALEVK